MYPHSLTGSPLFFLDLWKAPVTARLYFKPLVIEYCPSLYNVHSQARRFPSNREAG
jgi:hypothetical protein